MGLKNTILRALTWWHGSTFSNQLFTARKGQKVGEDDEGNVYYQTRDGKRRWVIYAGEPEASRVSPEWHGWLHHTWENPPDKEPLSQKPWQKPHQENLTGTPEAYAPAGSLRRADPAPRQDYEAWSPE